MTKKTYGQQINEHRAQNIGIEDDIIEYRRQMEPSVLDNISKTISTAKYSPLYRGKDFYIVLLMKKERIGEAPRTMVFARQSCPTPLYKQSVWKYHNSADSLEFLWSIPDTVLYWHIIRNAHTLINDKECSDLTKFVMLMESGELLRWVKKENGEKDDAVIKITKEIQA